MAIPEYCLRLMKVIYTARTSSELFETLKILQHTISNSKHLAKDFPIVPIPERLPRRQLRITMNASPSRKEKNKKHYIFQDFRYAVTFLNVTHPAEALSCSLGALYGQTNCAVHFQWHFPGSKDNNISLSDNENADCKDRCFNVKKIIQPQQHSTPLTTSSEKVSSYDEILENPLNGSWPKCHSINAIKTEKIVKTICLKLDKLVSPDINLSRISDSTGHKSTHATKPDTMIVFLNDSTT